jgi:DNA-directed RNA polymerase specialized sigma subunit
MKVPFKSYLGLQCKYFTSNKCRMFNSNKFKVLNNYYSINEKESYLRVNDKDDIKIPLDISSLNEIEKLIFKDFFIEDLNLNTISKKINLSKYKIKKKINLIKLKLFEQIKN